jgi:hypothetical protein
LLVNRPTEVALVARAESVTTHNELPPGFTVLGEQDRFERVIDAEGSVGDAASPIWAVFEEPFSVAVTVAV